MTDTTPAAACDGFTAPLAEPGVRQQVMVLQLATSALDSPVLGWSRYDGTGRSRPTMGDGDEPPYATGVDALVDGWRLLQASQLIPPARGFEHDTSYLPYEFWLTRLVAVGAER
ncbi:hypothetical protein [Tsukamurella strandjordii]|uniref:Uncharacterized protein n=1 Tax=Tsukamurella strandjordii TaxID=147577 RepID=A0AA90NJU2_9ACTN|nr:hypothetical protein [Tsukamurella strandjordii]MDP0400080.1 hypothetical protein [Tsukamurella strandjordii]